MEKNNIITKFFQKLDQLHMGRVHYKRVVEELFAWLKKTDDVTKDITTELFPSKDIEAKIITRDDIIVAGIEEVTSYFGNDIRFNVKISDGKKAKKGDCILLISGKSDKILSLERTMLNILQRMSGIATQTYKLVEVTKQLSTENFPYIAATRKTPWTLLDKKSVALGGGLTHRLTLTDGILIKDNHLEMLKKTKQLQSEKETVIALIKLLHNVNDTLLEIEVNTPDGALEALKLFQIYGINQAAILLDNWKPADARNFIKKNQHNNSIIYEASGNMSERNITKWATTGVDIISFGSITHSVKAADLSLEV